MLHESFITLHLHGQMKIGRSRFSQHHLHLWIPPRTGRTLTPVLSAWGRGTTR